MSGNGKTHPTAPEGGPWQAFEADLRRLADERPDEMTKAAVVAAAAHEAAAAPEIAGHPARTRTPRTRARRRTVFASLFSTMIGKILAGTVAVAAATAGAGAAGVLPGDVQDFVDENVFQRGVELGDQDRIRLQEHGGDLGEFVVVHREQLRERAQQHLGSGEGTQSQNQNQECDGAAEECPGEGTQSQNQDQQGPGEGTRSQNQNQNQNQECDGAAEECPGEGTQSQNQDQQGPGEGTRSQTRDGKDS